MSLTSTLTACIPSRPDFCNPRSLSKYLANATCVGVALGALGLLSAQIANGEIEPTASALETAAIGISLRTLQQINIDVLGADKVGALNNFIARWNLAGFESLWQVYLNLESSLGKDVIAHFVCSLFGYSAANDFFAFINQKRGDQPDLLVDLSDINKEDINRGTGFSLDSPKKRFLLHGAIAAAGIAAIVFGYQTDYLPHSMLTTAGCFLTLFGAGSIGTQSILMKKRDELNGLDDTDGVIYRPDTAILLSEGETAPLETRKKRLWRYVSNGAQLVGPPLTLLSLFISKHLSKPLGFDLSPLTFGAAGLGTGIKTTLNQMRFGKSLNENVYQIQEEKNRAFNNKGQKVWSRALRADMCAAVAFAIMTLGWFAYGIEDSSTLKEETGVGVIMGSVWLSGLLTLLADQMFRPGQSNRLINFLYYILHENSYLLPLGSLFFINFNKITDTAFELDADEQFIFGLMGLFMFGSFIGNVTSLNASKTRPSPAFSSVASIFEMGTVFLMMLFGKKSSQLV